MDFKKSYDEKKKNTIQQDQFILTSYFDYQIDEDLLIYEGKFTLENDLVKLKCLGNVVFKVLHPNKIILEGKILNAVNYENLDYSKLSNLVLDLHGYKPSNIVITTIKDYYLEGYISDEAIMSRRTSVDYAEFDIMNFDLQMGRNVKFDKGIYSGRLNIDYGKYKILIDKRPDFRKEMFDELTYKSGSIITHSGRIYTKDGSKIRTDTLENLLGRLSLSLSLINERRVQCICARGYKEDRLLYNYWNNESVSCFKRVPNWTSTISNVLNIEKFIELTLNLCESNYFYASLENICLWYIDSIEGVSIANNIVSVQTALEMLSYIILVELSKAKSEDEFDADTASRNIKKMLEYCKIDFDLNEEFFSEDLRERSASNVDLIVYLRNRIIHPSQKSDLYKFELDDIWNLILLGITYIELGFLFIIGYRGEYTNAFLNNRFGDVENTPW